MPETAVQRIQAMITQAEALAAIGALLQQQAGTGNAHPDIDPALRRVADELGLVEDMAGLAAADAARLASVIRAFMTMAASLVRDPSAPPGWTIDDPAILVSLGKASAPFAAYFRRAGPAGLVEALDAPGARFLDIGTGVGELAQAMAREFPGLQVTGIDPWEPSLRIARASASAAGLAERLTFLQESTDTFVPTHPLDVAWIPGPFLQPSSIASTCRQLRTQLRPGGYVVLGLFTGPGGLVDAVGALRAVRSGGGPILPPEGEAILRDSGFTEVASLGTDPSIQGIAMAARNP